MTPERRLFDSLQPPTSSSSRGRILFMRKRLIGMLVVLPALIVGVLTATPAEAAAKFYMSVRSSHVAIDAAGNGKMFVRCNASTTCRGKVYFTYDKMSPDASSYSRKYKSYAVPAYSYGYIDVTMFSNSPLNPNGTHPNVKEAEPGGLKYVDENVSLMVIESSPRGTNTVHSYNNLVAEEALSGQRITGDINAATGSQTVTDMKVRLWEPQRGGNNRLVSTQDVAVGSDQFEFWIPFRTNNVPRSSYRLEITGTANGKARSWWWRGDQSFSSADVVSTGGGRYLRDASPVEPNKFGTFQADFTYSFIDGQIQDAAYQQSDVYVKIAAPPPSYSGNSRDLAGLDIPRCANVYTTARTDSAGRYRADFLPTSASDDNRYMIGASTDVNGTTIELWRGATDQPYGSCYDAIDYAFTGAGDDLLQLSTTAGATNVQTPLHFPRNTARIPVRVSGFTPTAADQWVRVREQIPGMAINDWPIVAEGQGKVGTLPEFKLPPGEFRVETGRFSGDTGSISPCSGWYSSAYPDNNAYFSGADRGAERWKVVKRGTSPSSTARAHGFPTGSSGYKAMMYRNYCKSLSAGTYNNVVAFSGEGDDKIVDTTTASRGGTVAGTVKRNGGRTNKEMMVTVTNSGGSVVARYDLTDSKGKFYVSGLPKGTYSVAINTDSWRGIGRSFKGTHTVRVTGSGYYSVGTLYFRG